MSSLYSVLRLQGLDLDARSPFPENEIWMQVRSHPCQGVIVGGNIGSTQTIEERLIRIVEETQAVVWFVLSPADTQNGDTADLRARLARRCRQTPRLVWLDLGHVVPLDPGRALVGHSGFVPGQLPAGSLAPHHRIRAQLQQAAARYREVVFVCGIDPFARQDTDNPSTNGPGCLDPIGDVLVEVAQQWPHTVLQVWSNGAPPAAPLPPNLHVAQNTPTSQVTWISFAALPAVAHPAHTGNTPAPILPLEEAETVQLGYGDLPRLCDTSAPIHALFTRLHDLAGQPVEHAYAFVSGETAPTWDEAFERCVDELDQNALLADIDNSGTSLAHWLLELAEGTLSSVLLRDVGRKRVVGEVLRNIIEPGRICQGNKGTCAVTSIEIWLAERHPAEYARVISGLARPEGALLLYNGEVMGTSEDSMVWTAMEGNRSPISRLFQVAGMEYADPETTYSNAVDQSFEANTDGVEVAIGTGIRLQAFDRILEGLTGDEWRVLTDQDAQMVARLADLGLPTSGMLRLDLHAETITRNALAAGSTVFVTLAAHRTSAPPDPVPPAAPVLLPHKVRVLAIDDIHDRLQYEDPFDPVEPWIPGVVSTIDDPFGRCSMARADFFSLVVELSFRPEHAPRLS